MNVHTFRIYTANLSFQEACVAAGGVTALMSFLESAYPLPEGGTAATDPLFSVSVGDLLEGTYVALAACCRYRTGP